MSQHPVPIIPIEDPMVNTDSVGTQSKLLCPDHPLNMEENFRRLRLFNESQTALLGVCFVERGDAPTSGVFTASVKILPRSVWAVTVSAKHRLLVISDTADTTYNYMVDDV